MKLSNGVEWALHCCVSLSQTEHPVPTLRLAELHDVPPAYLAKHLQALARAGVVRSTQGQDGGYTLTRPAAEITMLDVVAAIDGPAPFFRCTEIRRRGPLAADPARCANRCPVARAMGAAELAWRAALGTVTIAELATDIDAASGGDALVGVRDWLREH
ncbi:MULTISPECIES: RrF2 family transcriptional regulator [Actinokineospora]|uniref:BadM/Rrf2 family transcriptional regulator n=2 Tax=Actinokineospora TaxID=39845 RepID=A0A421BC13_9PSEU|nr:MULTISPECIES: Rrf2 family transcriptional regulator [Actinokineospora]RLK61860.1 BadM/Rrf2 family transcriptional regulator [Actinokineospora cianjurensis]SES33688.1 transcriptional regulator, BadM/Rrf2 family [Actinokineospora terrae]